MKVTLYMAMSVDGYIAEKDDSTPWSDAVWSAYQKFVSARRNIILGRRTYEMMSQTGGEFEKIGNPYTIVVSSQKLDLPSEKFVRAASPEEAIRIMQEFSPNEIVLGGGATLNGAFLGAGLIDEMVLDIDPVILGDGIRLFGNSTKEVALKLMAERTITPQLIRVQYRILR